ncbi:MAG TPA: hypothetical protein PKZ22_15590 [Accumulibacter sp.]|jgi:hypothetical protein|nr:hypothetical protein [Accumulibacter sp.]
MKDTVTLYRPTVPKELALLRESGFLKWPPRLPEQPLFYPVTNEKNAIDITKSWIVRHDGVGYVTKFEVSKEFIDRCKVHQLGMPSQNEWSMAAEDVEALNQSIVGKIEIIREFRG